MPVIGLTIMKPFTSVCFSVCSVLVEHCDSWISHFHPCLGLLSLPSWCVHACALSFRPHSQRAQSPKLVLSSWKAGWWVMCSLAGELGALDPFSTWRGCQLPSLTLRRSQHLGNIKFWSSCLWCFPLCSWHNWAHWIFNSYLNTCFYRIFAFSPNGGLASDAPE